jgi:hypothetical protein
VIPESNSDLLFQIGLSFNGEKFKLKRILLVTFLFFFIGCLAVSMQGCKVIVSEPPGSGGKTCLPQSQDRNSIGRRIDEEKN